MLAALEQAIPDRVRVLISTLRRAGYRSWLVGGCVRDLLVLEVSGPGEGGREVSHNDWDIATDARPEEVRRLFSHVVPTGVQHGTVLVVLEGEGFEVTTLRGETTYSDGRRPDAVQFVDDIVADLARRDFTVNALAYDPTESKLVDPFGGALDLKRRVLKAVGNPSERFAEDGLRVLRAARFVATLEMSLDRSTESAIEPSLSTYRKVSAERIRDEWVKTMKARRPSAAFEIMKKHGLLAITAPEMLESVGCEQNRYHAYDVWGHAMACLDGCPPFAVLRMAGLLHDIGKPRTRESSEKTGDYTFYGHERVGAEMADPLLARLRFSTDERERIVALIRHHLICYEASWSDSAVRRWIRRVTPELLEDLYALNRADVLGKGLDPAEDLRQLEALRAHVQRVVEAGAALSVRDLRINGKDLIALGLRPGPLFGTILDKLLEAVLDDPTLNEREALLERARELAESA